MANAVSLRFSCGLVLACAVLAPAGLVHGHTTLVAPNGGETLTVGATFTIEWEVLIQHDTQDWDLFYSTTSTEGPWTAIAMDLPIGDPTAGSMHDFAWTVPDDVDDSVWVQVVQDNSARDYDDASNASFEIVPGCPIDLDGIPGVGLADVTILLNMWGSCAGCPADLTGDGWVGLADLTDLLNVWGPCS